MLDTIRTTIHQRLSRGAALEEVERELISESRALSEDERSALWLYAWSLASRSAAPSPRMGALELTPA